MLVYSINKSTDENASRGKIVQNSFARGLRDCIVISLLLSERVSYWLSYGGVYAARTGIADIDSKSP